MTGFGRRGFRTVAAGVRSPYVLLVLLFLVVFAYTPPRWQDWNQNSRFNLTRSLVEQQTVRIDDYVDNTGDYALIDGRAYTDKAPGLSFMAMPVYAVTDAAQPLGLNAAAERLGSSGSLSSTLNPDGRGLNEDRAGIALSLYIATFVTVAIPAAVMLALLAAMVYRITGCRTATLGSVLILGLVTPVFTYSQAFYGHVPAAACIVGAMALIVLRDDQQISSGRLFAIGGLLAWAVVIELPAAIVGLPVALWALHVAGCRAAVWGVAGALPPLMVLAVYDLVAFGTIAPVGYQHSALWQEQHSTGFMSLTRPHWEAVSGLLWMPFRGLFFYSPVLLLAIPGAIWMVRARERRTVGAVVLAAVVLFFLFVASSIMWWGGYAVGPRYLVPVLPLLAIPVGVTISRINRARLPYRLAGLATVALLAGVSGITIWAATFAGQNYPPDSVRQPMADYVWPRVIDGDVARNLGMVLQLDGVISLIPLVFVTMAGTAIVAFAIFRSDGQGSQPQADNLSIPVSRNMGDEIVTRVPVPRS